MAYQITVTTKALRNKATELQNQNRKLKAKIDELTSREAALNRMWDGDANDEFHRQFTRDLAQMNQFYNSINKYVNSLNTIAAKYEAAEQKNKSIAAKRTYGGGGGFR